MKAILLISISLLPFISCGIPWVGESRDVDWWQNAHNTFVNITAQYGTNINVLFYGDSITAIWAWENEGAKVFRRYYEPLGSENYGIGGDRTEHLLWRIRNGEVANISPRVCVILIGTNNLGDNDATSIATGIVFNVLELRDRLPNTKILLLGLLPRNDAYWTGKTSEINEIIKHLDNGRTIRFLDMKNHFYLGGDNFVSELYWSDLVHLSQKGYEKWAEVMDPLFREMLN